MMSKFFFKILLLTLFPLLGYAQEKKDSIYKQIAIDSVVVKGKLPIVKDVGTLRIVQVKGTVLEDMGTLSDVLTATPGMILKGRGFEVDGIGAPKYYVNGKEVTRQNILKILKSNNISKIEIEREPSSKYPNGTKAVVNIITVKPLKDYISLNLYYSASQRRKFSNYPSLDFSMKSGIWTSQLSYSYDNSYSLNKETYFKEIYHTDDVFRSDEYNQNHLRSFTHTLSWSNDFRLSSKHSIGFEYYFSHDKGNSLRDELMTYRNEGDVTMRDINRRTLTYRNTHNFSLSYNGKLSDNSSISLSGDYSVISNNAQTRSLERSRQTETATDIFTKNNSEYNILTFNANYDFVLPGGISSSIGGRFYNTYHPLDYSTNSPYVGAESADNHQNMRDNVTAGFLTFKKAWKTVTLNVGGRYEYSDTRITIATQSGKYSDRHHDGFFLPSASVSYKATKALSLQLSYRKSISRPGYLGLNPYPIYQDSLNYSMGNSDLISGTTNSYSLSVYWRRLTASVGYSYSKDKIMTVTYCPDLTTNMTSQMPINFPQTKYYYLRLSYSKTLGKFSGSGTVSLTLPRDKYEFLGEEIKTTKLGSSVSFNLYYNVAKTFRLWSSFTYQSTRESQITYQRMANNWTFGAQKTFFKKRLALNLRFTDILHKAHYNNVVETYVNTKRGTYGTNDLRGISFSATYKLFNKNISVRASRNNGEAVGRTTN